MEEESTLKLIMEKGPREGETLEFKPGSLIRVGRVVRGNTVAVKDAGVSSKHLSIQLISGKWFLTDLDSSNGTVLNDSKLLPMDPSDLSSDDTIKIGEYTSIKVKIELGGQTGLRRNPRRRARDGGLDAVVAVAESWRRRGGAKTSLASVCENSELGFRVGGELGKNQPGRPRSARVLKNEAQENLWELEKVEEVNNVGPIERKQGRRVSSRRTRSSTKEENLNSESMLEKIPENLDLDGNNCRESESSAPVEDVKIELGGQSGLQRNPRRRAKDGLLDVVVAVAENWHPRGAAKTNLASESANSELGFGVGGELGKNQPGRPRRARVLKNEAQENLWELEKVEEVYNVGPIEPKQGRRVSSRRTRSSIKEESLNFDSMLEKIPENLGLDGNNCRESESSAPVEDVKIEGQSGLQRNPRRRAKDGGLDVVVAVAENWHPRGGAKTNLASESENSELGFGVGGELGKNQPGRLRRARVLKNEAQEKLWELEKLEEVNNVGPIEPKQGRRVSSRRTRSSTKEESLNSDSMFENLGLDGNNCRELESSAPVEDVKGKRTRGGTRRKRNLEDEPLESVKKVFFKEVVVEGLNLQPEVCKEVETTVGVKENLANGLSEGIQVDVPEENEVVEDLNLRREGDEELPSVSGAKEGGVDARDEPDLEKMILGEWFDYLKVYLPKQIHDVTEEMISNMRHRAEQFHEFMLQHKNEKDEVKLPVG